MDTDEISKMPVANEECTCINTLTCGFSLSATPENKAYFYCHCI